MRTKHWIIGITLVLFATSTLFLGCTKKEEEPKANMKETPASNTVTGGDVDFSNFKAASPPDISSIKGLPKGLEDLEKITADLKNMPEPVEPVDPMRLKELIPKPPEGWAATGSVTWEKSTMGSFKISLANQMFANADGTSTIRVEINDNAHVPMLYLPWKMQGLIEKETDTDYMKSTKVAGNPALERFHKGRKNGELNILIADRFVVGVKGENIKDAEVLHTFAKAINLAKIGTLDQ